MRRRRRAVVAASAIANTPRTVAAPMPADPQSTPHAAAWLAGLGAIGFVEPWVADAMEE
jgi:hypothetical protein